MSKHCPPGLRALSDLPALGAFATLAEEAADGERLFWDRAAVHRVGTAALETDRLLAVGVWAVALLLVGAALVLLADSSRRGAFLTVGGALLVVGYGVSLVFLGWYSPTYVVAGWCVSVAWVSGLWLALRLRPVAAAANGQGVRWWT